jgi:hypothetical protein
MTRCTLLRYALPVTGILLFSGCTTIGTLPHVAELQSKIENLKQPIHLPTQVDVENYAACMAPLSAKLKPGLLALTDKLHPHPSGPFLSRQLAALDESMLFDDTQNLRDYLNILAEQLVTDIPSSTAIKDKIDSTVKRVQQETSPAKADLEAVSKRSDVYLKAYFTKNISQITHSLLMDDSEKAAWKAKIADVLQRKPDDPMVAKVLDKLTPQIQKLANNISDKSSPGFIGRDGTAYNFPGATNQCAAPTHTDHSQIEADVIRIILESLRDTYAPLPVLANSTAATIEGADTLDFGPNHSVPMTVGWHINHRDPGSLLQFTLTADQFQDMAAKARSAEASVAGAVGKAIRGGSWGSLNNEAVARSIETAAGVLARHAAERAEWCLQAQRSKAPAAQP